MRLYYLIIAAVLLTACGKEEKLTPTPATTAYTLPQGNNSYDDTIVAFHKKFDSYILYKFSQADYSYNFYDQKLDTARVADTAYISPVLDFFHKRLLNQYPESFLRKTLPFKILLAEYLVKSNVRNARGFSSTTSAFAIAWANSSFVLKTPAELKQISSWMHRIYMERAFRADVVKVPTAFSLLAPADYNQISDANKYANGILAERNQELNLANDFLAYIEAITANAKTEFETKYLKTSVDKKGLIKKRYDIIIAYFQNEFGVDLQAIGNLP